MLEDLREEVHHAYRYLSEKGFTEYERTELTALDRPKGLMVCRPAGQRWRHLKPENYLVVSLKNDDPVEGKGEMNDVVRTHLNLYRRLGGMSAITSGFPQAATVWAQVGKAIPCLGVVHATRFSGAIPVTVEVPDMETERDYRLAVADSVSRVFEDGAIDHTKVPGVLVARQGPFAFGSDPFSAIENLVSLEHVAAIALEALRLRPDLEPFSEWKTRHHFEPSIFDNRTLAGQKSRIARRPQKLSED